MWGGVGGGDVGEGHRHLVSKNKWQAYKVKASESVCGSDAGTKANSR